VAGSVVDVTFTSPELEAALREYREAGADLSPCMAIIAENLAGAVSDMYDSSGHGAWKALAPSTLAKRRGGGRGAKPLVDSGILSGSTESNSGADFAEATTGQEYIKYHLDGGPIIPRRNPFDLPDEVIEEAAELVVNHILGNAE
jgi:phage gpG-like protein